MSVEGTRYAHSEGRVCVAYGGSKVYTVGMDGEMRIWAGIDDDDCENISLGEEAFAIAVCKDRIFVSTSETNNVTALNLEGENDGILTKFTADVTCLDTLESGALVASGSADMTVKVTNTTTYADKHFSGHKGPILSVSLDPQKKYCASSSCDGTVKVWDLAEKKEVLNLECVPKSNDVTTSKTVCGLRFNRSGSLLAVPRSDNVVVLDRDSWQQSTVLRCDKLAEGEMFTCVDFSSDGAKVMAGTSKGNLCVWSTETGDLKNLVRTERKFAITAIAASPNVSDEASFADSQGYWGLASSLGAGAAASGNKGEKTGEEDLLSQEELEELFNAEDEEGEEENSFSISKIQASTGFLKDDEGHLVHEKSTILAGDLASSSRPVSPSSDVGSIPGAAAQPKPEPVRRQPTFQPASSPDHFTYRFLVYNSIGVVKTIQDNNIDVDFHDNETHYSLFYTNTENFTMAALTDKILVLGREGDEETSGRVNVKNFKAGEKNNDWTMDLPEGEFVDAVCAGEGWVAVGTSSNYVRIMTSWGVQREILSLSGSIVSMVGSGGKLFVVLENSHPLPKQHFLAFITVHIDIRKGLNKVSGPQPLPVSPNSDLFWIGLSDTVLPVTTDSRGIVRMLIQGAWYVLADTKSQMKGKSDTFFVTCVDHKDNQIRGIKCRGARYPQTVPKPSPSSLKIELPLCITGERGGLEQRLMQSVLLNSVLEDEPDLEAEARSTEVQCFMKLFALACRADEEYRAIELCKLMPNLEVVQMAIQYASQMKKVSLVFKLGEVAMSIQEAEEREQRQEEQGDVDKARDSDEESQDMFESSQSFVNNPLLKAQTQVKPKLSDNFRMTQENRNPFARKVEESRPSTINDKDSSTIVFDSANAVPKKKVLITTKKKPLLSVENKPGAKKTPSSGGQESGQLKGFNLYLAENRDLFPGTPDQSQESALQAWKSMEKEEKEQYKSPRFPVSAAKRKRSDGDKEPEPEKKSKSVKSKLSAFSFAGGVS